MPVHDWSRVRAGRFHHFHNSWIYKLSDRLNAGVLPPGFYAAGEQVAGDIEPDVLTLTRGPAARHEDWKEARGVTALEERPPDVSITMDAEDAVYVKKKDRIAIRAVEGDRLVALIEIVSKANKASRRELERLLKKVAGALDAGCHLLVIDLQPPGGLDPRGIHGAVWEYLYGDCPEAPPDRPLTLVSYRASPHVTAFIEPLAVGDALPEMPLFLDADWYVGVPLEETYRQTWAGFPEPWKEDAT